MIRAILLAGVWALASTASALAIPSPGQIAASLASVPSDQVAKLVWVEGNGEASLVLRRRPDLVLAAFQSKGGLMKTDGGWFQKGTRFVEVDVPVNLGDVVDLMVGLADRASQGMGHEYGMMLYADAAGSLRCLVQQGGWLKTAVAPKPVVRTPDGELLLLISAVAHTHPFGAPVPSASDHQSAAAFALVMGQRFQILVVPGGSWVLYDGARVYGGDAEKRRVSIAGLFAQ